MKKVLLSLLLVLATTFAVFGTVGCESSEPTVETPPPASSDGGDASDDNKGNDGNEDGNPQLQNFTGITFEDKTVNYDGQTHTIDAVGVPSFATVEYTNHGPFTNAGTYTIGVKVSADNYNTYEKTATLTVNKIDFTGITFEDRTEEYDGQEKEIVISGTLPTTASVVYTSDMAGVTNSASQIGVYNVTATITDINHNTKVLQAKLTIKATDEERFMAFTANGILYFQNAMDDNELYAYDTQDEALERVSGDIVSDLIPYGTDGVMMVSKTLFMSSIKTSAYNGSNFTVETVLTESAQYIQANGDIVYYVVNGLTQQQSGIYKTDFSGDEPVTTLLSVGKAKYLKLDGTKLYFADGNNGYKLSSVNTTSTNQTRTLVVDEKINNLVVSDGALYYTVNNLLGNYIEKYTISSQSRKKLTIDAGASLTVVGDYLYYVNVDKFTTNLIGAGIYKVSTSPLVDNNLPGSKVIEAGALGVCSLASDTENLYYYDVDGYKLMQYNLAMQTATNLLENFEKPEDPTPISTGSKLAYYAGKIYYLDIWDGKTLRCYDPATSVNYRMTTEKTVDFAIIDGILYVNTVSAFVNNDTYYVDLRVGGTMAQLNAYSAFDFCSDGTYLYYVEENAAGVRTAVHKCNLDGSDDSIIYNKGVTNLRVVGDFLYFVDGNNVHAFNVATGDDTTVEVDGREIHTTAFDTDGTYLYYRDMYGLLYGSKRLARCKLDGSEDVKIVETGTDPIQIVVQGEYVYYYTDTTAGDNGLYRVVKTATAGTTPTEILNAETYYAKDFVVVGESLYFVDYKSELVGNAHLYKFTVGDAEPTLIR